MMRRLFVYGALACALGLGAMWMFGDDVALVQNAKSNIQDHLKTKKKTKAEVVVPAPAVTVVRVKKHDFVEKVLVTGSLVARDEIVVVPEVEGLRIAELLADEGDLVEKGDVLAILENEQLRYQLEQRDAALKRSTAAIAQAKSQITEAKARQREASDSLKRAKPLQRKNYISESVVDQRRAASISATAQVAAAEEGLAVALANKAEIEAQRRELAWRVSRAEIKAPVSGLISKRNARLGEIAIGANAFSGDAPMFRMISKGEVELDAEVPETQLAKVVAGQGAFVDVAGLDTLKGRVRLVSPEIEKTTRLGRVRIFLGDDQRLKLGSFARGIIETRRSSGLAVPLSSVIYTDQGPSVLVVEDDVVKSRLIHTGLISDGKREVVKGLKDGDLIVAKSGTFLRDGDQVRAILPEPKVSEAAK